MIFEFGPYKVDIDIESTKQFYAAGSVSERCSCDGCRNYEKAVNTLPSEVQNFFASLGVDISKACEVYVNCGNADGTLLYGGFYHLCGSVLEGSSAWVAANPVVRSRLSAWVMRRRSIGRSVVSHWEESRAFQIADDFSVSFQPECALLEKNFPLPALQLEISARIPWVLPGENPYQ